MLGGTYMKSLLTILVAVAWCGEYALVVSAHERPVSAFIPPAIEYPIPEQTVGMSEASEISESRTDSRTGGTCHAFPSGENRADSVRHFWKASEFSSAAEPLVARLQI